MGFGGVVLTKVPPGLEDAVALERGVDAGDGVGVDTQLDGQLADGRELIAGPQLAGGDGGADGALELRVNRRRIQRVEREVDRHAHYCISTLVQRQVRGDWRQITR